MDDLIKKEKIAKNIGFVSTRFAGIDGVTLEASKWAEVLSESGHNCFWFAGKLDREPEVSFLVPEAHFQHEKNQWINAKVFDKAGRIPFVTKAIHELRSLLKSQLHEFINKFDIDLLIAENVLSIPMHIPLGLALTETIVETQIPTISHNHDFFWERGRFSVNGVNDYIRMAFPPNLHNIKHVVINSEAQEQLAFRTGISSVIIPNVLDFDNPPVLDEKETKVFRESIGLEPDDRMILQPTRVIKRKGIEYAIELLKELKDPHNKLVVSHEAGDEGLEYVEWLQDYACEHNVDLRMIKTRIADPLANNGNGGSEYSLWDVYPHADFITYPSLYEGFGNAFLEAVYFKKPILINRYATFVRDIEPLGFDLVVMDGFISRKNVENVIEILTPSERREKMVAFNYSVATRHFSYSVLRNQLNGMLSDFFGDSITGSFNSPIYPKHQDYTGITQHPV